MLINNINMHNSPYYPPIHFLVLLASRLLERCWKRWGINGLQQAESMDIKSEICVIQMILSRNPIVQGDYHI